MYIREEIARGCEEGREHTMEEEDDESKRSRSVDVAMSAMLGQGKGRVAGASRIISSNRAIAEANGGQAKPVTATALSCEASGGSKRSAGD